MNTRDLLETIIQRFAKELGINRNEIQQVLAIELQSTQSDTESPWRLRMQFVRYASMHPTTDTAIRVVINPLTGSPTNIVVHTLHLSHADKLVTSTMRFLDDQQHSPKYREKLETIRLLVSRGPLA